MGFQQTIPQVSWDGRESFVLLHLPLTTWAEPAVGDRTTSL